MRTSPGRRAGLGTILLALSIGLPTNVLAGDEPAEADGVEVLPWWEGPEADIDGWKLHLHSRLQTHHQSWAVPLLTVGSAGLVNLGIGGYLLRSDPGLSQAYGLAVGGALLFAAAGGISVVAFPSLARVRRLVDRASNAGELRDRLRKVRKGLGWTSLGMGIASLSFAIGIPFMGVYAGIASASFGLACIYLGHGAMVALVFEQEAGRFAKPQRKPNRFARSPRWLPPPRLVSFGPTGLTLVF